MPRERDIVDIIARNACPKLAMYFGDAPLKFPGPKIENKNKGNFHCVYIFNNTSNTHIGNGEFFKVEVFVCFFIEYIFGWQGIGKVTVDALEKLDFPVVMGSVLISATFFILINIIADVLYGVVDPRVRVQ